MRNILMTLAALMIGETIAIAQPPSGPPQPAQPAQPPAPTAEDKRLDAILQDWSQRMSTIQNFYSKCVRTDKDPVTKKETILEGEVMFMRPKKDGDGPNLAKYELVSKANPGDFEKYIFKEKHVFQYLPHEKLVMVHEMPQNNPANENYLISFLKGMKPSDAKKRYNIVLQKENEYYAYVLITPKYDADKQEFVQAQLAIWLKSPPNQTANVAMMPARFWYREPNKKEVTYLFSDMIPNAELDKSRFVPTKPQGWEVKYANASPPANPATPPPPPIVRPMKP